MKKTVALLLSLMLLVSCLSGCGDDSAKPAEDAVMVVDGIEVSWDEFMYYLSSAAYTLENYYSSSTGAGVDWDGSCMYDRNVTNAQWCVNEAKYNAAQACKVMSKAKEKGVELTEDQIKEAEDQFAEYKASFDSEEEFSDELAAYGLTPDTYLKLLKVNMTLPNVFKAIYGENGEKLDDASFEKFVSDNGYMTSAHILFTFDKTQEDGSAVERSDAEKAELKAQLEGFIKELRAISDDTERSERFFELMQEYSEDPGKTTNPKGYCFTEGVMVQEYTDGTKALADYEVSDIVETTYGYHVIMRLPVERDQIPSNSQYGYTLGYTAASYAFDDEIQSWDISSGAKLADAYADVDFTQFFGSDGFKFTNYETYSANKKD